MVMIPVIALATAAVAFLLFLSYQVWWQLGKAGEIENLLPLDLEAFRNLTDPEEVRFLRVNLSPKEFRRIQRMRLRAAAVYISVISHNAGRLVVIGRSVSADPDAETAAAGRGNCGRGTRCRPSWVTVEIVVLIVALEIKRNHDLADTSVSIGQNRRPVP